MSEQSENTNNIADLAQTISNIDTSTPPPPPNQVVNSQGEVINLTGNPGENKKI